jgi:two-component system, LytTR family, sensor kinase
VGPEILVHQTELVNVIGHSVGAVLFGVFLWLLIQDRHSSSRLSLLAAGLALAWDLLSLVILATPAGPPALMAFLLAASLTALSLLPAVLLDICLERTPVWLVRMGYAVSALAIALHWIPGWHSRALWLVTMGFAPLAVAGFFATRRSVATMSLLLLALSFAHLAQWPSDEDWRIELALHHASIPLALYILLQDFRFLFLDAFVRVCANVVLAGALASAALLLRPGQTLWIGCTFLLLIFAWARPRVESTLLSLLFPRRRLAESVEALKALSATAETDAAYLAGAHEILAQHMNASIAGADAECEVPLRYSNGDHQTLRLSRRQGGRRYLSEDLRELNTLAQVIVERVEQIRGIEMRRLVAQAELHALEAQIHPHFLFNALNTLYGVIPRQASEARELVLNLADILRYFLQTERTYIPLEEEIRIVEAYLEIESLRLGAKLRTEIDIEPSVRREPIPILSIEPLVENAVKHGVASRSGPGHVKVTVRREEHGVVVRVEDSGRGFQESAGHSRGAGVGLENVRRRLKLCYGEASGLEISSSGQGTVVGFLVPVALGAAR